MRNLFRIVSKTLLRTIGIEIFSGECGINSALRVQPKLLQYFDAGCNTNAHCFLDGINSALRFSNKRYQKT